MIDKRREQQRRRQSQMLAMEHQTREDLEEIEAFIKMNAPSSHSASSFFPAQDEGPRPLKTNARSHMLTTRSKVRQDEVATLAGCNKQSPPLIRMKSTEMSPLVETIEVSEDLLRGGQTENASDVSNTPSDWRNGTLPCP